jgi:hypothetical protein
MELELVLETVACYYSFSDCQVLIGEADHQGNLTISWGRQYRKIAIEECAKELISISDYTRSIWINKHEPLEKALSNRGVGGQVDFSQEDLELKDLFLSLKHTQKIKMSQDLEAEGNKFPLALQILVKALINPLTRRLSGGIPMDACGTFYDIENDEIDPRAELRDVLKMFDTF